MLVKIATINKVLKNKLTSSVSTFRQTAVPAKRFLDNIKVGR